MTERADHEAAALHRSDAYRAVDAFVDQIDGAVRGAEYQLQPGVAAQQAGKRRHDQASCNTAGHVDPQLAALAVLKQLFDIFGL